uniref:Uncharacterized protein n=1 Tax=Sus scrofa TaxID=9823 RepID=A0A4X1UAI3_PIG
MFKFSLKKYFSIKEYHIKKLTSTRRPIIWGYIPFKDEAANFFFFFFLFFWPPHGTWSSQARDQIRSIVTTKAAAAATPDP